MDLDALSAAIERARAQGNDLAVADHLTRRGWRYQGALPPVDELRAEILASIKVDDKGCWIWQRELNPGGYGIIYGRGVHRVAYEAWHGPIPEGLVLDHLCYQRACCNVVDPFGDHPDGHLEPVTGVENTRRAIARGQDSPDQRVHHGAKNWCKHGHEFTAANTGIDSLGKRYCKTCRYAALKTYRKEIVGQSDRGWEWRVDIKRFLTLKADLPVQRGPWIPTAEAAELLGISVDVFSHWRRSYQGVLSPLDSHRKPLLWSTLELELLKSCWTDEPWNRTKKPHSQLSNEGESTEPPE